MTGTRDAEEITMENQKVEWVVDTYNQTAEVEIRIRLEGRL